MQARHAGQHRRPAKRRNRPHRPPGSPHTGKHHAIKHPVAKQRTSRAATRAAAAGAAAARAALLRSRHSLALASLGVLMLLASCATPRIGETSRHSLALMVTDFDSLPGWNADHVAQALPAFLNT